MERRKKFLVACTIFCSVFAMGGPEISKKQFKSMTKSYPKPRAIKTGTVDLGFFESCVLRRDYLRCWSKDGLVEERRADEVAVGNAHACYIYRGTVRCFGNNEYGQATPPKGLRRIKQILARRVSTCALSTDGKLICWGELPEGVSSLNELEPARVFGMSSAAICVSKEDSEFVCRGKRLPIDLPSSIPNVKQINIGVFNVCVLQDGGKVQCWSKHHEIPGVESSKASEVPGGLGPVKSLAYSDMEPCVILMDGKPICWGSKYQVSIPNDITEVISLRVGFDFACALLPNALVRCWGRDWGSMKWPNEEYCQASGKFLVGDDCSTHLPFAACLRESTCEQTLELDKKDFTSFGNKCLATQKNRLVLSTCSLRKSVGHCDSESDGYFSSTVFYNSDKKSADLCAQKGGTWNSSDRLLTSWIEKAYNSRFSNKEGLAAFQALMKRLTQLYEETSKSKYLEEASRNPTWYSRESMTEEEMKIWEDLWSAGGGCGTLSAYLCMKNLTGEGNLEKIHEAFNYTDTSIINRAYFYIDNDFCPLANRILKNDCSSYAEMQAFKKQGCQVEIDMQTQTQKGHVEWLHSVHLNEKNTADCWGITNSGTLPAVIRGGDHQFFHSGGELGELFGGDSTSSFSPVCPCNDDILDQEFDRGVKEVFSSDDTSIMEGSRKLLRLIEIGISPSFLEQLFSRAEVSHNEKALKELQALKQKIEAFREKQRKDSQ